MSRQKLTTFVLGAVLAAMGGLLIAQDAVAQQRPRDAGSKARGEAYRFWVNQRPTRSLRHAREYSRDLYRYSRDTGVLQPGVAKSESEELGRNIEKARRELAAVAKQHQGDKQVQAALETVNKHVATAAEVHKQLHEECCKDAPNGGITMHCCNQIIKELDKAAAEYGALLRTLEQRTKTAGAKEGKK